MSICRYCGQSAGWFKDTHDECVQKAQRGIEAVKQCVSDGIVEGKQYSDISTRLDQLVSESDIPQDQVLPAIKEGWSDGARRRSIIQPVSDSDFSAISDVYRAAGLTAEEMRKTIGLQATTFSFLIWTVLHDQIEPYHGPVQFNLQHGEVPVFGMANVLLTEERTVSSYVSGYSGASIRVANGVYYHLGGARGHREQSASLQEVDYGGFLMTTQSVYFGGTEHGVNFRVPYKQVVRFQSYSDAVGICKNGAKEKIFAPQHVSDSGWFLFNLLQALAAREAST